MTLRASSPTTGFTVNGNYITGLQARDAVGLAFY